MSTVHQLLLANPVSATLKQTLQDIILSSVIAVPADVSISEALVSPLIHLPVADTLCQVDDQYRLVHACS